MPASRLLQVKVTTELLEQIQAAADREGLTLSAWIRRVATLALRKRAPKK